MDCLRRMQDVRCSYTRYLGKGVQEPPPLHPRLEIGSFWASSRKVPIRRFSRLPCGRVRQRPAHRPEAVRMRGHSSPPLFNRTSPLDQKGLSRPLWTPLSSGENSLSPNIPIEQVFRDLHHDQDRGMALPPWTGPLPRDAKGASGRHPVSPNVLPLNHAAVRCNMGRLS